MPKLKNKPSCEDLMAFVQTLTPGQQQEVLSVISERLSGLRSFHEGEWDFAKKHEYDRNVARVQRALEKPPPKVNDKVTIVKHHFHPDMSEDVGGYWTHTELRAELRDVAEWTLGVKLLGGEVIRMRWSASECLFAAEAKEYTLEL